MTKSSTTPIVMLTLQDLRDVIREEMGSNVNVTHESETPSASQHVLAKLAGKEVVFGLAGICKIFNCKMSRAQKLKNTIIKDAVQERWGIRAIQIHIHRDEGHYENSEEKTGWKPNYHAHIVWDWINPSTGKSYKLSKADMSKMQDLLAEMLKMQRGQKKSETGLEHLDREKYILQKMEDRKQAVRKLQAECESANRRAERADRIATGERRRASDAEEKVQEMLAIPEIKEIWETIRRNKEAFRRQINQWITDATKAISDFAKDYDKHLFSQEDESVIGSGIIAEAYMCGLDPTDQDQRTQATESLLGKVNRKGTTPFMSDLAASRTKQLNEEMSVSREILEGLMLAAGGRGGVNMGGGGSNNELTNWDGTKKNTGWGRSR